MQGERMFHRVILIAGFIILAIWLYASLSAGISGDEYVHHQQAEYVIDYFASWGQDRSALATPVTNLKYYGQGYDNWAALVARLFNIDDVFTLRHIMSVLAAWLIIVFAYKLGKLLGGVWVGVLAAVFLLLSPRFIGHSFNNLKDIPFALSYIMSVYYIIRWIPQLPRPELKTSLLLILSIGFSISIRPAGILMICYLVLFSTIWCYRQYKSGNRILFDDIKALLFVVISGYLLGILFWPYALENPFWHPLKSHFIMSNYPVTMRQLFEGRLYWSDQLPWYYILKYIAISAPLSVVYLFVFSPLLFIKGIGGYVKKNKLLLLYFVIAFPLLFILFKESNLYGGARHLLFITPIVSVLSALLFFGLIRSEGKVLPKLVFSVLLVVGFSQSARYIIKAHPYQYTFFNAMGGGIEKAYGAYETDYYYTSLREGLELLLPHIPSQTDTPVIIASNFRIDGYLNAAGKNIKSIYTPYYKRGNVDWDYGLFVPAHLYPHNSASLHWPVRNALFEVKVKDKPLCIGFKRSSDKDFQAFEAINVQSYDAAIRIAKSALETEPFNLSANMSLAKTYYHRGQLDDAEKAFNTCLYILPNYEPALWHLGMIGQETNRNEEAEARFKTAIEFNPKFAKAYISLAELYIENGNVSEAVSILNKGLNNKPNDGEIREMLNDIKEK